MRSSPFACNRSLLLSAQFLRHFSSCSVLFHSRFLQSNPFSDTSRVVSIICACGLPSCLSCNAKSAHIPSTTKFSCMYTLIRNICSCLSNSAGRAISISLAVCASLRFSTFSTAFHKVVRSLYSCGAFSGNIISE